LRLRHRIAVAPAAALALAACATTAPTSLAPPHAPIVEGGAVPVVPHPDPRALLQSDDPQLAANKRLVFDLVRSHLGSPLDFDALLAEDLIGHSPWWPTGRHAFPFPDLCIHDCPPFLTPPIITLVAEGDLVVAAFVGLRSAPDGSGAYTTTDFEMFRIENGRIAEHWTSAQLTPGGGVPSVEDAGPVPVTGVAGTAQLALIQSDDPALRANKRTVYDLWRQIPDAGREELTDLYLDPIYIQHNPNAATGSEGFRAYMANRPDTPIETHYRHQLVAMVAEGDLVVQVLADTRPHPDRPDETYTIAWFDMFRIENGRLAEHWDAAAKGELRRD
jgi:predicted SnoaL-like aldol condensation-catalyzing enzyme